MARGVGFLLATCYCVDGLGSLLYKIERNRIVPVLKLDSIPAETNGKNPNQDLNEHEEKKPELSVSRNLRRRSESLCRIEGKGRVEG